jgi:hypothetical protein
VAHSRFSAHCTKICRSDYFVDVWFLLRIVGYIKNAENFCTGIDEASSVPLTTMGAGLVEREQSCD